VAVLVRALLACSLTVATSHATALGLGCDRLDAEQADELSARLRLLLQTWPGDPPARVTLDCRERLATISVVGSTTVRETVDESHGLVEGVLDAVERIAEREAAVRAAFARKPSEATPAPPSDEAAESDESASSEPGEPLPAAAPAASRSAHAGGVGVGATLEVAPAPVGMLLGPRLDVAVGSGPVAVSLSESLRWGSTGEHRLRAFDVTAGLGYGAPFVADHLLGAQLQLGVEWLSVGVDRLTRLTEASTMAALGLRGAQQLGPLSLWVGLDLRLRFRQLGLAPPVGARLARVAPQLSIGGVFLADDGR
jgi:hypothetical protein